MQEAVPVGEGSMAAVLGLESDKIIDICRTVEAECGEAVQAVNFNCPGQVVIAGSVGAVDKALAALKEAGAKRAVLLPVSAPVNHMIAGGVDTFVEVGPGKVLSGFTKKIAKGMAALNVED